MPGYLGFDAGFQLINKSIDPCRCKGCIQMIAEQGDEFATKRVVP